MTPRIPVIPDMRGFPPVFVWEWNGVYRVFWSPTWSVWCTYTTGRGIVTRVRD